ncbi:NAD-dependent epimerase/dehydratase family protein [Helicobacter sp. 23-1045]
MLTGGGGNLDSANNVDLDSAIFDKKSHKFAESLPFANNFGILHLATKYLSSHKPSDISDLISANITFGSEILEGTLPFCPKFFINILTFSQFANSANYNPLAFYDGTKEAFYNITKLYSEAFKKTKFLNLLLYNTYGSGDVRGKFLNLWDKISRDNQTLEMSAGEQKIDISHIDDIMRGLDLAICDYEMMDSAKIYTLENRPRKSLREIAKIFESATGRRLNIAWGSKAYRKNEIFDPISSVDSAKFIKLPHFSAKISLEDGIKRVFC